MVKIGFIKAKKFKGKKVTRKPPSAKLVKGLKELRLSPNWKPIKMKSFSKNKKSIKL